MLVKVSRYTQGPVTWPSPCKCRSLGATAGNKHQFEDAPASTSKWLKSDNTHNGFVMQGTPEMDASGLGHTPPNHELEMDALDQEDSTIMVGIALIHQAIQALKAIKPKLDF